MGISVRTVARAIDRQWYDETDKQFLELHTPLQTGHRSDQSMTRKPLPTTYLSPFTPHPLKMPPPLPPTPIPKASPPPPPLPFSQQTPSPNHAHYPLTSPNQTAVLPLVPNPPPLLPALLFLPLKTPSRHHRVGPLDRRTGTFPLPFPLPLAQNPPSPFPHPPELPTHLIPTKMIPTNILG